MNHVTLSRDKEFLNRVVNDPSVFPYVSLGTIGPLDVSPLIDDERNLFFANEFGGFLLVNKDDGVYDVHTQFLPDGRGLIAAVAALEVREYMFTETDCVAIMTFCPLNNKAAERFAVAAGFRFIRSGTLLGVTGNYFGITKEEWLCQ